MCFYSAKSFRLFSENRSSDGNGCCCIHDDDQQPGKCRRVLQLRSNGVCMRKYVYR